MLTAVGLGERIHYKPKKLSRRQNKRVAVARGLVPPTRGSLSPTTTARSTKTPSPSHRVVSERGRERGTRLSSSTHDIYPDSRRRDSDRPKDGFSLHRTRHDLDEAALLGKSCTAATFSHRLGRTLTTIARKMKREEHRPGGPNRTYGDVGESFYLDSRREVVGSAARAAERPCQS